LQVIFYEKVIGETSYCVLLFTRSFELSLDFALLFYSHNTAISK